ncbi:hypothetical protein [Oceaniglobus indicus]|uniref:hypothetical protein n=1 Tax=Oceaniglobus indicus TaxID=2047749 RepID=UPI001F4DBA81|nr:hypothetical protein [Oceaniglobus indicus]
MFLVLCTGAASAQTCTTIRFAPGTSSGEVSGQVIENKPMCFTFESGAGQTARLQLSGSDNACFTIRDVVDCQDDYSFRTQSRAYEVGVFQLFAAAAYEQFTLRLSIR